MGNTDAVFTMDVILKLLENRAVNSLTPEKNVSSDVYTVRPFSFRDWKMTAGFTPQLKLQKWWARVNPQLKPGKIPISYLLLILTVSFTTRCFQFTDEEGISDKGVLRGVAELLTMLSSFSDRMKYSFFYGTEKYCPGWAEPCRAFVYRRRGSERQSG